MLIKVRYLETGEEAYATYAPGHEGKAVLWLLGKLDGQIMDDRSIEVEIDGQVCRPTTH